jgi:hypothetical protein
VVAASAIAFAATPLAARADAVFLPTGQYLTPTAAPGAVYQRLTTGLRADGNADANGAVSTALSPDGTALLVLSSGYNYDFFRVDGLPIVHTVPDPITGRPSSTTTTNAQWIFVYDVTGRVPVVRQRINVPNTYCWLAWSTDGHYFAAPMDDVFSRNASLGPYSAVVPGNLRRPPVDPSLIPDCGNAKVPQTKPLPELHSPAWWAAQTRGFDFRGPDRVNSRKFNAVLWAGQKGASPPYPR